MGRLTGGDPSLLRRINSAVVLHSLRDSGDLTLTDLTRITGLSRPTVEGVVEGLIDTGLVVESAPAEGGTRKQGRPARRFRFRAEAGYLLGIEIGPHRVAALISGLDGRIIGAGSRVVSETADADERLERVRLVVADVLRRTGVSRGSLRAVGVGSPGIVEADGTVRLGTALPQWTGLPLGERLRRSFRCPVLVENDANTAAVAEQWKGAAIDSDDIVFVLAGLSPGAGALIGGRLHRGFGGAAGEIGALHLLGRG
ncbi:ROK family transcriptional regulator, partial [Streptomyces sp. NPDC055039]